MKKRKVYLKQDFVSKVLKENITFIELANKIGLSKTFLNNLINNGLSLGPKSRGKITKAYPGLEWDDIFETRVRGA